MCQTRNRFYCIYHFILDSLFPASITVVVVVLAVAPRLSQLRELCIETESQPTNRLGI